MPFFFNEIMPDSLSIFRWWDTVGLERCVCLVISPTRIPVFSFVSIVLIILSLVSFPSAINRFWHLFRSLAIICFFIIHLFIMTPLFIILNGL